MPLTKEKTEEIIKKIEEAIRKKTGETSLKCPVCTNNQFSLAGGFTADFLVDKIQGGLVIGGPILPSVPIVCTNCGNTFFLNAKVLGIEEDKDIKNKNPKIIVRGNNLILIRTLLKCLIPLTNIKKILKNGEMVL